MSNGIEIKNLPSATTIKQNDTMTIVQDKQNKQLTLDRFANESDLATLSVLENRCDEVKAKIEVDEYSAEITTSQSMSKIGSDDSGVDLHENVLDGAFESCVLKGKTKYRDIDTGEILEDFEEGRNLELITVRMPILRTVGKNLFDLELTQGAHGYGVAGIKPNFSGSSNRVTNLTGTYIKVNPNTKITFSILNNIDFAIAELDINGHTLGDTGWVGYTTIKPNHTITTKEKTSYIGFNFRKFDNSNITVQEVLDSNPMLEISGTATTYEPHKSSILSLPKGIVLRNIGSVKDTLDLNTGEYIQKIGEVTFDGSKDEKWILHQISSYTTHTRFGFSLKDNDKPLGITHTELKCDKFTWINSDIETEHIKIDGGDSRIILYTFRTQNLYHKMLMALKNGYRKTQLQFNMN
jgi:hypothetical protein